MIKVRWIRDVGGHKLGDIDELSNRDFKRFFQKGFIIGLREQIGWKQVEKIIQKLTEQHEEEIQKIFKEIEELREEKTEQLNNLDVDNMIPVTGKPVYPNQEAVLRAEISLLFTLQKRLKIKEGMK